MSGGRARPLRGGAVLSTSDAHRPQAAAQDRFEALFDLLYARLYALVYRLTGDPHASEDVLQEAFVKLANAAVLTRPDEEVAAWLRRVALNLGANYLRGERRLKQRLERAGRLEQADARPEGDGPARLVERREQAAAVRRVLAELPERQRDCLVLRHSGHSYAEIAAALDLAPGSVGVVLARAERIFRERYL
jgi:RNA polymerase sigma-70 factor (ECF subfamily)